MFRTDDTIAAVSSPAGSGGRAIVRLSGPEAIDLAHRVFQRSEGRLDELRGFRATDGLVRIASAGIELPGRAYLFRAPGSFTRQDVVELHVPAASPAVASLLAELIAHGARQAEPGEFTARAFFSGRIDLSAAEAVADIINAEDDAQLRSAVGALSGSVGRLCRESSEQLTEVLAGVEASIDLAEEDVVLDSPGDLAGCLMEISSRLTAAARQAMDLPDVGVYPAVVLAGRPNVGKSSLLNALSEADRAIVSAMAGTTRDVLSTTMALPGGRNVSLMDAAGFAHPFTPLAAAAHQAARQAVCRADVLAFVVDASRENFDDDLAILVDVRRSNGRATVLLLANKADLVPAGSELVLAELRAKTHLEPIATSAVTGCGLEQVRQAVADCLHMVSRQAGETLGLHQRQKRCLLAAADAARQAVQGLSGASEVSDVAELVAIDLRQALCQLGGVTGQVVTEDILGRIFARFCVGK